MSVKATFAPRYRVAYGVKGYGGKLEAKTAAGQPLGDGLVDPDTEVTFTATPDENYVVAGWTGVTATPTNATTTTLTVTADADVRVAFKLKEATLTFKVLKKGTTDLLQGAEVKLEDKAPKYTDGKGLVQITNLQYGTYSYTVKLSGAQTVRRTTEVNAPTVDETVELTWDGAKAIFTVTDGTNPIQDAIVQVGQQQTKTDQYGKAVLSLDKKPYKYSIEKVGYYDRLSGTVDLSSGDQDVAVELVRSTATATFTVTADGKPLEGATVTIAGKSSTTDATGMVALTLPTDSYDYTVEKSGYTDATGTADLRTGNKEVAVTLQKKTTAAATFMVAAYGNPIEGATVTIEGKTATTDAQGKAALTLPTGNYSYSVTKTGYIDATGSVDLTDGDRDVAVELVRKAATATFTVTADGNPLEGAPVTITGRTATTDADGKAGYNDAKGSVDLTEGNKIVNVVLKTVEKPQPKPTVVESALLANVAVAPNPFVEMFHLTGVESLRSIQVFTVDGVLVLNHTHDGASEAIFQAGSWTSGIYILRLIDLEGAVKQLRVVKQQ